MRKLDLELTKDNENNTHSSLFHYPLNIQKVWSPSEFCDLSDFDHLWEASHHI